MAMVTLNAMKNELYGGKRPFLKWENGTIPTEADFVSQYFPEDFYQQTFPGAGKRKLTLYTVLSDEARGAKSQRNKVFNGKYKGNKMEDDALPILRSHPDFWEQLRVNCQQAIVDVEPGRREAFKEKLLEYGRSVRHDAFYKFLEQKVDLGEALGTEELETAYAALIMILMARRCIDEFLEIFNGSILLEDQYGYLDHPKSMMKRSFAGILYESAYEPKVQKAYQNYSALLGHATEISCDGMSVAYDDLLDKLYEVIRTERGQKLVQIIGPSGAEKNAITQLLYLRMSYDVRDGKETKLAPYYINLGKYFRDGVATKGEAQKRMRDDLSPFENFCGRQPHRIPLLFVDGIKTYSFDGLELDYVLNQLMMERLPNAQYVIAVERGVVMNPHRQKKMPIFASARYRYEVSMESVYLFDKRKSTEYLDKFREIYLPNERGDLYKCLRRLGFDHVDTYQLRVLIGHLRDADNIFDLYETICMEYLSGDTSQMDKAAQWAFEFAYTDKELTAIPFELQQLINMHDSFVEYFIARYYCSKLRDGTAKDNVGLLNMVLPKGVTRFIVPMLNSNPADESRMLDLIERAYDHMELMAKSEMTYWLGRIKAPNLTERAELLLLRYYRAHKEEMAAPQNVNDLERKRQLFLLRGISVSLIVKGHREVWDEYLESLIKDPTANEINRGFHLEYYGDKTYLPVYDTLNFEDDIQKGQRTLDQLMAAVDMSKEAGKLPTIFELNLFTICSLLQARVEHTNRGICFDIMPYLSRAISQVKWYLEHNLCDSELLRQYFLMCICDFQERNAERRKTWNSVGVKAYGRYTRRIFRTGWVDRAIPEPETVAEHVYNTWMLGMFLLPDEYTADSAYSKQKILELILIHDMAEAVTGDIRRPDKETKKEFYKKQENDEMGIMLLRGTYPSMPSQYERYKLWQKWDEQHRDINGRIAKELDLIQSMYMLLTYYGQYPERFKESEVRTWLSERSLIRTIPGSKVLRTVIMENQEFRPVLEKLDIIG